MNILFLTIAQLNSIDEHSIYTDLLRCFSNNGHSVYTISPNEKKSGKSVELVKEKNSIILHVPTGDVTGARNLIKKGFAQLSLESIFIKAINKYFCDVRFDLVIYSTPPITFCKVVEFVKKRDGARSYLLLKDIFPQNAIDLGMLNKDGVKGLIYKYFRRKEKHLYALSDKIGCMSQANVDYVLKHNIEISPTKVEICPNSIEVVDKSVSEEERIAIRKKYNIPLDKKVFIYGGNLGKPQGIPFLIKCLEKCKDLEDVYFFIVGNGTEYSVIDSYAKQNIQKNLRIMRRLPKDDYDRLVGACDVGMIFLDHRFTIPNFPSRLLSYMQVKIPTLACTDPNTDIGKVIKQGGFGFWCESNSTKGFCNCIEKLLSTDTGKMGIIAFEYLQCNYSIENSYNTIISMIEDKQ